jgi:glycosyltransferase involved in cell wall biosynthesis
VVAPKPAVPLPSPWLAAAGDRLTHVPWGVDTGGFAVSPPPPPTPFTVGFLAVLAPAHAYKGLSPLLAAVALLRARGVPVRLRVGGSGERQPWYQAEAEQLGIAADVEWLGRLPDAGLPAFYGACHAFALPSTSALQEGFGLVAVEALACGRPLVATPIVAVAAEAAAAAAGVLVPPGDPAGLADALAALAADPRRRAAMGERARALAVARYDWESVADAYEALLAAVVAEAARRPGAPAATPRGSTSSSK